MKRIALAIIMVAILVGGTLGGIAAAGDKPEPSPKPTDELLMEKLDALAQQVATIEGNISAINTEMEKLDALALQVASIEGNVSAIGTEIGNIEGKLDDPSYGLEEIKAEVSDIEVAISSLQESINDLDYGLDAIVTRLEDTENRLSTIETSLSEQLKMERIEGHGQASNTQSTLIVNKQFPQIRHISLTVTFAGMGLQDGMDDTFYIFTQVNNKSACLDAVSYYDAQELHNFAALTYEFDSTGFAISADDFGGAPLEIAYSATTIYSE